MRDTPEAGYDGDVLIAGAGAAGLAAGLALADAGFDVIVAGPLDLRPTARTVALFEGSIRFLRALGVWDAVEPLAMPLETMRIIDDTGSLFRPPPAEFHARELGLSAFGQNIENHSLIGVMAECARPRLRLIERMIDRIDFDALAVTATLADGARVRAPLIVAADGRKSFVRRAAGIAARETQGDQVALTAIVRHTRPHREVSTEFHTRGGPFTLVPLPPLPDAPHRSSLVWLMPQTLGRRLSGLDDGALAKAIETQAQSFLGAMTLEGPRGLFPMAMMTAERLTGARVALIGEAAHVFPPIGAQGLNLGLRDAAHLAQALSEARAAGEEPAGTALETYERLRAGDIATRSGGVHALNSALLSEFLPVDLLRGFGLLALSNIAPLRRAVMRQGIMPGHGLPKVMQDRPRELPR